MSESGIGALDLSTGRLSKISPYARGVSGMGWMSVDLPWIVWEQGNSQTDPSDWSVLAWDRDTGERVTVATSRAPDGTNVFGQPPFPLVRGGVVTWAQPLPRRADYNEAEIRVFDLAKRTSTTLASGRVSSPVFAGPYMLWGTRTTDGKYAFSAVDADTLRAADLPARLRDPGPILYLAGSAKYLAWTSEDALAATVWTVGSGQYREYRAPDIRHLLQFPQLAGHYLMSYGGISSTVIDLDTGAGFDVAGSVAGSDDLIVKEESSRPGAGKGEIVASRLSSASLGTLPGIATCSAR
jgi:hypothetical protein